VSETTGMKSLNILIVEDDQSCRELIVACCKRHNHTVRCAAGVEDALAMLAQSPCEVLIADIGLPDGSGWYLLERAGPILCPYAIAVSGFDSPQHIADSVAAGFRRHLVKPFAIEDLIAALEDAALGLPDPKE